MAKKISTKEKVLKAASRVFSENGYKETTVRMISEKAGVNVASVNYYFGDKEQLYLEVIRYWAEDAFRNFPDDFLAESGHSPEEKIELFVYHTLLILLGPDGRGTGFGRLMALEASVSPSSVVHEVVAATIKEPTNILMKAVAELTGTDDAEKLKVYSACVVGQTVYFYLSKNLIQDLFDLQLPQSEEELHKISRQISSFALAALKQLSE